MNVVPVHTPGGILIPAGRHESFRYQIPGEPDILWDVTIARAALEAGYLLTEVEIPRSEMQEIANRNAWDPVKLDAVDPAIPGIGAPLVLPQLGVIYVLIDGLHRNARALRDGLPFRARLLTDDAARACFLEGPLHLMPWGQR